MLCGWFWTMQFAAFGWFGCVINIHASKSACCFCEKHKDVGFKWKQLCVFCIWCVWQSVTDIASWLLENNCGRFLQPFLSTRVLIWMVFSSFVVCVCNLVSVLANLCRFLPWFCNNTPVEKRQCTADDIDTDLNRTMFCGQEWLWWGLIWCEIQYVRLTEHHHHHHHHFHHDYHHYDLNHKGQFWQRFILYSVTIIIITII